LPAFPLPQRKSVHLPLKEKDRNCKKRYNTFMKRYNMVEAAKVLKVTRQTIYYWIKKGWVKPARDYRDYPVFTEAHIRKLKSWKSALKVAK